MTQTDTPILDNLRKILTYAVYSVIATAAEEKETITPEMIEAQIRPYLIHIDASRDRILLLIQEEEGGVRGDGTKAKGLRLALEEINRGIKAATAPLKERNKKSRKKTTKRTNINGKSNGKTN